MEKTVELDVNEQTFFSSILALLHNLLLDIANAP